MYSTTIVYVRLYCVCAVCDCVFVFMRNLQEIENIYLKAIHHMNPFFQQQSLQASRISHTVLYMGMYVCMYVCMYVVGVETQIIDTISRESMLVCSQCVCVCLCTCVCLAMQFYTRICLS